MNLVKHINKYQVNVTATVGDLVAELLKFDQSLPVYTEGCDCIGNVVKVSHDESDNSVLIERDDRAVHLGKIDEQYLDKIVGEIP